jgi:phosphate-selective porin
MNNINFAKILFVALAVLLAPVAYAAKADKVDVIVVYEAKPDQAEKDRVEKLGGELKREFDNFDMRVISISENAVEHLGKAKGVKFVAPDRETFGMAYLMSAPPSSDKSAAH